MGTTTWVTSAVLAAALTACTSPGQDAPSRSAATDEPTFSVSAGPSNTAPGPARVGQPRVLADHLQVPWGVAFLPGGDALVSERDSHRIVRVEVSGRVTPVGRVAGVTADTAEGGLLGLALSPTFDRDHLLYAYLTTDQDNQVVRMRYENGRINDQRAVFTGIPHAAIHDGGRIAFGPDGMLYVTTGDATQRDRAQERSYLGGKVLRMTPDGEPAPGNPFPDSVVYTLGHRNPEGLAWGPGGRLYEAELGQNSLDEVNLLRPGRNYGWPTVEGTIGPRGPRFTPPLRTFATGEASPSGLAYAGGSLWLATLQGERVYRIPVHADGSLGQPTALFDGRWGRLRTAVVAPDGSLWITTSNRDGRGSPVSADDRIIRIPLS